MYNSKWNVENIRDLTKIWILNVYFSLKNLLIMMSKIFIIIIKYTFGGKNTLLNFSWHFKINVFLSVEDFLFKLCFEGKTEVNSRASCGGRITAIPLWPGDSVTTYVTSLDSLTLTSWISNCFALC